MSTRYLSGLLTGLFLLVHVTAHAYLGDGWLSWYNPKLGGVEVVKLTNGQHLLIGKGTPIELEPYTVIGDVEPILAKFANHFWLGDSMYAVSPGIPSVFKVDTAARTIKHAHFEYLRGSNFYATQFERGGEIFSFGGGGLWTRNVVLTVFSTNQQLWNAFGAVTPFEIHKQFALMDVAEYLRSFSYYDRTHDALFVVSNSDVWMYSFTEDEWVHKGKVQDVFPADVQIKQPLTDSTFLVQSDWTVYELDLYHNTWYDVTETNKSNTSNVYETYEMPVYYPVEGMEGGLKVAVLRRNENQPDERSYATIWEHTAQKRRFLGAFYVPLWRVWLVRVTGGVAALVAVVIFFVLARRTKRSGQLVGEMDAEVTRDLPELRAEELAIIQALLREPQTTDAINVLLGVDQQSDDSQRRRRSDFMRELNALSQQHFGHDLVVRNKDRNDRRIVVYAIAEGMEYAANQLLLAGERE